MIHKKLELTKRGHKKLTLGKRRKDSPFSPTEIYVRIGNDEVIVTENEVRDLVGFFDYVSPPRLELTAQTRSF